MFSTPNKDLTLAFAGIFQSATLVYQLAKTENHDSSALHESSFSLLRLNADSTEEVFGSTLGLRLGLDCIVSVFGMRPDISTREIFQYAVGMHQLGTRLKMNRRGQQVIQEGLTDLRGRYLKHYREQDHDTALHEDIASLYTRSISYMSPRIIVQGAQGKLENPLTVSRVRTALFAGIRAAWLWHQLGGRRWQLIFHRKGYQQQAQRLLRQAV